MLVFEDEILKRRDSVLEARVDKLLTELGLLEEEQYGFTKAGDTSTSIYTVASAIEDARVREKEIWIEFKDQDEKAFDTLEAFQGKVKSCMVLGIPIRIAQKWLRFDKSLMVEIINAYGTILRTNFECTKVHSHRYVADCKADREVLECGNGFTTF